MEERRASGDAQEGGEEGPDPELRAWLEGARGGEEAALGDLLGATRARIDEAERSPSFRLRSLSTAARRGLALGVVAGSLPAFGLLLLRDDAGSYPLPRLIAELSLLGLLLLGAILLALRPLHRPEPPGWLKILAPGLALAATFAVAAFPPSLSGASAEGAALSAAPSCFVIGTLLGLPVYALLRLLDRGPDTGAILAACAAGLTGNLALQLHCAMPIAEHMLAGHFSVALAFVGGVLLLRRADHVSDKNS